MRGGGGRKEKINGSWITIASRVIDEKHSIYLFFYFYSFLLVILVTFN